MVTKQEIWLWVVLVVCLISLMIEVCTGIYLIRVSLAGGSFQEIMFLFAIVTSCAAFNLVLIKTVNPK